MGVETMGLPDRPIRSRMRRELYKGKVVQACARQTAAGKWQPVISIQLGGGVTEFYQALIDEVYETMKDANSRSVFLAKRLIDEEAV